jgi:hypothetical protein
VGTAPERGHGVRLDASARPGPDGSGAAPRCLAGHDARVLLGVLAPHLGPVAHRPSASSTRTWTTVSVTAGSGAHVTSISENGRVSVSRTLRTGGRVDDAGDRLGGALLHVGDRGGCEDQPMAISSTDVGTGSTWGAGAA